MSCTLHDSSPLILPIKHKGRTCLPAGSLQLFGSRVPFPLHRAHTDNSESPPYDHILRWESKTYKMYLERKAKFNYVRMASIPFDLCPILLKWFEAVPSVKRGNSIPHLSHPPPKKDWCTGQLGCESLNRALHLALNLAAETKLRSGVIHLPSEQQTSLSEKCAVTRKGTSCIYSVWNSISCGFILNLHTKIYFKWAYFIVPLVKLNTNTV